MSVFLVTTLFYKALILQGEIWCWSLLKLKGLNRNASLECYPVSYLYVPLSFSEIAMAAHLFILQQLVAMLAFSMVSYKS